MTGEDKGFKMLQQQYATKFSIPVREDIWEKRGMFTEQKLEEYENTLLDDIKKAQVISFKKQKTDPQI